MDEKTIVEKVEEYSFYNDIIHGKSLFDELCSYLNVRGEIRRLVMTDLLKKNHLPMSQFFRYFISKTQAMPLLNILKRNGFLIESSMRFIINPVWLEQKHGVFIYPSEEKTLFFQHDKIKKGG